MIIGDNFSDDFKSRIEDKKRYMNITDDEIKKFQKYNFYKTIIILHLFIYIFFTSITHHDEGLDIRFNLAILITSIITFVIFIVAGNSMLKMANPNKNSNYLYTPKMLDIIILKKELKEKSNIIYTDDTDINIDNLTKSELQLLNNFILHLENIYDYNMMKLYIGIPSLVIGTFISILNYSGSISNLIFSIISFSGIVALVISMPITLIYTYLVKSREKLNRKRKNNTLNKIEYYYKYGCIDYKDYKILNKMLSKSSTCDKSLYIKESGMSSIYANYSIEYLLDIINKNQISKEEILIGYFYEKYNKNIYIKWLSIFIVLYIILIVVTGIRSNYILIFIIVLYCNKTSKKKALYKADEEIAKLKENEIKYNEIIDEIYSNRDILADCISSSLILKHKNKKC